MRKQLVIAFSAGFRNSQLLFYKKLPIFKVAGGARFKDYRGCIEWLENAGLINVCYCLQCPELPLNCTNAI